jgi:hypothetical protein
MWTSSTDPKMLAFEVGLHDESACLAAEVPGERRHRVLETAQSRRFVHRNCADGDRRLGDAAVE